MIRSVGLISHTSDEGLPIPKVQPKLQCGSTIRRLTLNLSIWEFGISKSGRRHPCSLRGIAVAEVKSNHRLCSIEGTPVGNRARGDMKTKSRIKVIKKGTEMPSAGNPKTEKYAEKRESRDMVETISEWVRELQMKKREESKGGVHELFGGEAQTSGT